MTKPTALLSLMILAFGLGACQTPVKYADIETFQRAQNEAYFAEAYRAIDRLNAGGAKEKTLAGALAQELRAIDPNSPRLDEAVATTALARVEQILAAGPEIDGNLRAAVTAPLLDLLGEFRRPVLDPAASPCETPPALAPKCPGEPIIVDATAPTAPGSRRFKTLGEALASLPATSECKQRIVVEAGWHDTQGLAIARNVVIEGAEGAKPALLGGVDIVAPVSVTLKNLIVLGFGDAGVDAVNRCASLALYNARVSGSIDYGVRQRGGRLIAADVEIDHTKQHAGDESAGLFLENGTAALIVDARIDANEGAGALLDGAGTHLWARDLSITETEVPTGPLNLCDISTIDPDALGGLVARHGASADIHALISDNDVAGLHAHSGGRIDLGRGEIRNTTELRDERCGQWASGFGGVGAFARGGAIRLAHFDIDNSGVCGVRIGEAGDLDASHGVIRNNPIGACIQAPGFDYGRISEDVIFLNNNRNVDASALPIPPPGLPEY